MKLMLPEVLKVSRKSIIIHNDAKAPFELFNSFEYQVEAMKFDMSTFSKEHFNLPCSIRARNGKYQVFSGWNTLHKSTPISSEELLVLNFPKKLIKDIEEEAWRYLVDSFTNTYQRNLVLAYLSLVMENIPRGVKEKILPQCKSNSAESLVQFLCREKRGPVRLQNERLKAKEIILPFKL
ncbi:hypothetical protein [Thalassotalea sp. SU-HH00458]|uniref:hypothetical protein n=1 Tax=Thalassotalea sp. SU-HH00458 TaxID=3127657 RepID=UPI00310AB31F